MAIKTFTAGEVLTAADTNTYLANSGLTYISRVSLSGAGQNIEGCFTSTYRDYRILVSNGSLNGATDFTYQLLVGSTATTAGYWWAYTGLSGGGSAANQNGQNSNPCRTGASATGTGDSFGLVMDIFAPQVASFTFVTSQASNFQSDDFRVRSGGSGINNTTQYNGIKFLSAGGQTMTGTVSIYGYRQP